MSAIPLVVAELDQHLAEVQSLREALIKLGPLMSAIAVDFERGQRSTEAFTAAALAVNEDLEAGIAANSSPAPAVAIRDTPASPTGPLVPGAYIPPVVAQPRAVESSSAEPTEDQAIHVRGTGVAPATFSGSVARTVRTMQRLDHPVRKKDLRVEGQLTSTQVDHSLTRLMKAGVVTGSGQTTSRRYALKPDLEVVWNGTMDRQGTTFSLVGGGSL